MSNIFIGEIPIPYRVLFWGSLLGTCRPISQVKVECRGMFYNYILHILLHLVGLSKMTCKGKQRFSIFFKSLYYTFEPLSIMIVQFQSQNFNYIYDFDSSRIMIV